MVKDAAVQNRMYLERDIPVSYTHLDVYKRQDGQLGGTAHEGRQQDGHFPVSYTHLFSVHTVSWMDARSL